MKAIKAYFSSWNRLSKYRYPIVFLFFANIIFTFIVTSPFTAYFRNKLQFSDALDAYNGFDIYGIMEFVNNYGLGLEPLNILFIQLMVAFFIFGVYSNSAVLYAVLSKNHIVSLRPFWNGGLNHFWKILRLSLYYILALIIMVIVIWKVLLAIGINVLEVSDDVELMRKLQTGLLIGVIFSVLLSIIKQYAKIFIAIEKKPLITISIYNASKFVLRNLSHTILLYLVNIGIFVIGTMLYIVIRNLFSVDSWIILFILAQGLLLFKIVVRIVHLDSSFDLYEKLTKDKSE